MPRIRFSSQQGPTNSCIFSSQVCSRMLCSGVLGDTSDRTIIIATGAFIWSVCTIGVSMSTSLVQACSFTSMNGLGLALVIPCAQSLMADYFPAEQRGRAFGAMQLTMSLGSMVGSLYATNVAKYQVHSWLLWPCMMVESTFHLPLPVLLRDRVYWTDLNL